jgi:hypothetical protein
MRRPGLAMRLPIGRLGEDWRIRSDPWSSCGLVPGTLMRMLKKLIRMFKKPSPEPPSEVPTGPQPLRPSPMVGELHGRPDRR